MLKAFKLWSLAGALKARGNAPEAFSAVIELGRIGSPRAIELLLGCLPRGDGVARAAARELGRLGAETATKPLVALLGHEEVQQSAAEALAKIGAKAVPPLTEALRHPQAAVRARSAAVLGEIGDKQAVEPLLMALQADDDYAVRATAATALGQLKEQRAIWGLVAALKLRDETTPEAQAALEALRHAATLALRRLGNPLTGATAAEQLASAEAALQQIESSLTESDLHPRLVGDLNLLSEAELIGVLKELIAASEEVSWASLERREPMLASWFATYDRRREVADTVGRELHRRGGSALVERVATEALGGHATIQNWWKEMEWSA